MSISFLIISLSALFAVPLWTHSLYEDIFRTEKTMIGMDNGAIILGRGDRATLNFIEKANKFISGLEKIHHPLHALLISGVATPNVVSQDQMIESLIRTTLESTLLTSQSMWLKTSLEVARYLADFTKNVAMEQRSSLVPVDKRSCSICFLTHRLEVDTSKSASDLFSFEGRKKWRMRVEIFQKNRGVQTAWDYHFKDFSED